MEVYRQVPMEVGFFQQRLNGEKVWKVWYLNYVLKHICPLDATRFSNITRSLVFLKIWNIVATVLDVTVMEICWPSLRWMKAGNLFWEASWTAFAKRWDTKRPPWSLNDSHNAILWPTICFYKCFHECGISEAIFIFFGSRLTWGDWRVHVTSCRSAQAFMSFNVHGRWLVAGGWCKQPTLGGVVPGPLLRRSFLDTLGGYSGVSFLRVCSPGLPLSYMHIYLHTCFLHSTFLLALLLL